MLPSCQVILTAALKLVLRSARGISFYRYVTIRKFPPQVGCVQLVKTLVERPKSLALHKPACALIHRQLAIMPNDLAAADGGHHLRKLWLRNACLARIANLA